MLHAPQREILQRRCPDHRAEALRERGTSHRGRQKSKKVSALHVQLPLCASSGCHGSQNQHRGRLQDSGS